jgi:predicted RNA-binding Zn ribbon-like protein
MHDAPNVTLVGGHPALDLVNSIERGVPRPERANQDFLVDPDSVARWARRVGVLVDGVEADAVRQAWRADPARAGRAVDRLIGIRESTYRALRAALDATDWDTEETRRVLEHLHREWQAAVTRSRITCPRPGPPAVRVDLGSDPDELVPDRAAQQALELLSGDELGRVRECPVEAGGCGWLFVDRSRNGSRRWCRMADCGNKVKAGRLTARRRAARDPGTRKETR